MNIFTYDKWFTLLASSLFVIMFLDMAFTVQGVSLGFEEANPIIRWVFNLVGVRWTAIIFSVLSFIAFVLFLILRLKTKKEINVYRLYAIVGLLLSFRAFIVGSWYGALITPSI